jgi:LemA protein
MIAMSDETPQTTNESAELRKGVGVCIVLACIVLAVLCLVTPIIGSYNGLVDSDVQVQRAAANIQTDMERRADLIPNLAATVKGSAVFEHDTLVETTLARAGTNSASLKDHISKTSDITELAAQNEQLTQILGNFVKLQEQYPALQTTQQFREFGAQVTATENEILADRQTYNAAVMQYQSMTRSFPSNIIAGWFGFKETKYSMWEPSNKTYAETVPTVDFSDMNP